MNKKPLLAAGLITAASIVGFADTADAQRIRLRLVCPTASSDTQIQRFLSTAPELGPPHGTVCIPREIFA